MTDRRAGWLLCAFGLLPCLGCGPSTAEVHGKVNLSGRTVVHGTVVFLDETDQPHGAEIQPDGSYSLSGIPTGNMRVYVYSKPPGLYGKSLRTGEDAAVKLPAGWFELPEHYAKPETSNLTTTLKSGANEYNIDLR